MKVAGSDKRRNFILIFYTSGWCSDDQVMTWEERKESKETFCILLLVEELSEWLCSKVSSRVIISHWRQTHPGHSNSLHLTRVSTQLAEPRWLFATLNLVQTQHSANVSTSFVCSGHTAVLSVMRACTESPTLSVSRATTCGMSSEVLAPTGQTYF